MKGPEASAVIRAAGEGSSQALDRMFREVCPKLLRIIRLRLGPSLRRRLESQDILQATLLKAFERLDQFEGSGSGSLMAWLAAIARNEIRDQADFHQRKRRDLGMQDSMDGLPAELAAEIRSAVSLLHLREQEARLESALEALEPDHREVIVLRKLEELSFAEIGERMGRSADACRMLLARAMAALARATEEPI
jgi:RNA polymerase sigma-70 factor (ECF subfamily)